MANQMFESQNGLVFGIQGWSWGEPRPTSITFFLDGSVRVSDQHGRAIKGVTVGGEAVIFANCTHQEALEALAQEGIDWTELECAGWPQLPYEALKEMESLPPTPKEELQKIPDRALRKAALRAKHEAETLLQRELEPEEEDATT